MTQIITINLFTMEYWPALCGFKQPKHRRNKWLAQEKTERMSDHCLSYRLQLLLLLDQKLKHQIDICQVQVLLVWTQHILEHLPPRTILKGGDSDQLHVWLLQISKHERLSKIHNCQG